MRKKTVFNNVVRTAGLAVFSVFALLIALAGAADALYPDVMTCFGGSLPNSFPAFSVDVTELKDNGAMRCGSARISFLGAIPLKDVKIRYFDSGVLLPGGMAFGVKLYTGGLIVTRTESFVSGGVNADPASDAGIRCGDIIVKVEGAEVTKTRQFSKMIEQSGGTSVKVGIVRDKEMLEVTLTPAYCDSQRRYKAGLWVKDSAAGIGTVTFVDPETLQFAGLGHGICEQSTGELLPITSGEVWAVSVDGVVKGESGDPGELKGSFLSEQIGVIDENTAQGVFGTLKGIPEGAGEPVEAATESEIVPGDALILCTVDGGGVKSYGAKIERIVDRAAKTKNFIIKITDPELLAVTGGIVQGMSGSPVLQNGKLVGAVTHVLVNDPTRGYGIFIGNMLEEIGASDGLAA
ncbi:MAG: SpoIVB peptidase [Clostridia bacterium]|nr:SpoIVB peptidase [Clostridia bacterium]